MGAFDLITSGAAAFTDPFTLFLVVAGSVLGIIFGAIPGLTATMGMAIFLPMTFSMTDVQGIVFLIGIYVGACYSGSIPSILVNIPGTPSSIATGFDGYPMTQKGEAGRAIGYSTISSALGGLFGVVILAFAAPVLAGLALEFGAQEYTGVALLGISIVSYISFGSTIKGLIGAIIGLLLATVGQDVITGFPRFVFGSENLQAGLEMIPVMVGFFGVTEVLTKLESIRETSVEVAKISHILPGFKRLFSMLPKICLSSSIGTFVGAVPAAGGAIAAMGAYGIQKRFSKRSDEYGTGIAEGLVAAEAANNAAVGGALVPMLSLGIPGDPQTAILIGALMINGLVPGPMLFLTRPDLISTIYIGNVFAIGVFTLIGLACARYFALLIRVPQRYLLPGIMILCVVGAFAIRNSLFDVWVLLGCGFLGYLLQKIQITAAPIILGFVLGPILEDNFRRSLIMSNGDWTTFFSRPLSLCLIGINLFILIGPFVFRFIKTDYKRMTIMKNKKNKE